MKSLILAGGFARRLAPLTDFVAKPLLPLSDKLVIDWVMERINELEIDEIGISTNSYYEKQFRYWIKCRTENIKLIIEPTQSENEKLGAIAGIKYAMDRMGHDEYLVIAGDNVFDFSLQKMLNFYRKIMKPVLAVYNVEDIDKAKRFGVVTVDENWKIINMQEKPKIPESSLISTATYIFTKDTKKMLEEYLAGMKNHDSLGYFFSWLSENYEVYAYPYKGLWKDIGNLNEYRELFRKLK